MFQAWNLWKECRPLELLDNCLEDCCIILEFVRCLHISFLCLQQHHEDRPNMSSVVMMLHGESSLPEPKEPAFFIGKRSSLSSKNQSHSTNEITVTLLEARQPNFISIALLSAHQRHFHNKFQVVSCYLLLLVGQKVISVVGSN